MSVSVPTQISKYYLYLNLPFFLFLIIPPPLLSFVISTLFKHYTLFLAHPPPPIPMICPANGYCIVSIYYAIMIIDLNI